MENINNENTLVETSSLNKTEISGFFNLFYDNKYCSF